MSDDVLNGTGILIFSDKLQLVHSNLMFWWSFSPLMCLYRRIFFVTSESFFFFPPPFELENNQDVDLVRIEAPCGVMCLRLIEYFDQKPCLIYIEMIPLLVEKIRINWFPWDSRWKSFEAVQSREWKNVSKIALKASWKCLIWLKQEVFSKPN